ncbi:MAG: fatty acyl-AMP ligase, partial [Okeania sp. SIO1F9]
PKGVIINESNVLAQIETLHISLSWAPGFTSVKWLPLYHDMGLVTMVFSPIVEGYHSMIMSPMSFIRSPYNFLKAIERYGAYLTTMPNFGLKHALTRLTDAELDSLDLSCLKQLCCGAEPINSIIVDEFKEKFKAAGLDGNYFLPCYGMAETVLMITMTDQRKGDSYLEFSKAALSKGKLDQDEGEDASAIYACGNTWNDTQLIIVDSKSNKELSEGMIGEVWVSGSTVAEGYYNQPTLTEKICKAFTDKGQGPFLRTGDLGALINNNLYITGRLKDMIIVRGGNIYPEDVELMISGLFTTDEISQSVVFGHIEEGTERIIILLTTTILDTTLFWVLMVEKPFALAPATTP